MTDLPPQPSFEDLIKHILEMIKNNGELQS